MIHIHTFTFGPFQENTYILYNEAKEAVIIDPGNMSASEDLEVKTFISNNGLSLKRLLLTHAHVDHISGNRFIFDTYGLLPELHREDIPLLERHKLVADMYGLPCQESPMAKHFLNEGDIIQLGTDVLDIYFTPGHAPGHVVFHCKAQDFLIAGDVLFRGSIGRTDLPGGDFDTLIRSIKQKLFPLADNTTVYSGHGPSTTIGFEKKNNPFLV